MLRDKVERVLGAGRLPARQPRRQGADRHPRVATARPAGPDRDRGPVRDGDWDPRPRRAPARPPVRVARPARPVRRLPAVPSARPLQHRQPAARRTDPRRGVRRRPGRLDAAAVASRVLVRIHYIDPLPARDQRRLRRRRRSRRGSREATRAWSDDLRAALIDGARRGARARAVRALRATRSRPATAPTGCARAAVVDIDRIERARAHRPIRSWPLPDARDARGDGQPLQAVQRERRAAVRRAADVRAHGREGRSTSARTRSRPQRLGADLGLRLRPAAARREQLEQVRDRFAEAFLGVWRGELEDDGLNGLVLGRRPDRPRDHDHPRGRAATCARRRSRSPIATWSARWSRIRRSRCCSCGCSAPASIPIAHDRDDAERSRPRSSEAIDAVQSLDEDRILRSFLAVVGAILRTNYFRTDADGKPQPYLSFKLDSPQLPMLPLPRPQFEIFVYSPRVEGVHLRGGKVARGGLRWSDRREDFRTEVLGLMKAQMVKNALIVPVGSKGGFVVKRPPAEGGREALLRRGDRLLRTFLRGLLDLTDNTSASEVVAARAGRPLRRRRSLPGRRRRQGDRHVLRHRQRRRRPSTASGSATRSPPAARTATTTSRWGSPRAARGSRSSATSASWAPTSRASDFTVVGIGDMSGRRVRQRDAAARGTPGCSPRSTTCTCSSTPIRIRRASYDERRRLFELPRSSWSDYDHVADLGGRRRVRAQREVDHALARGPRGARRSRPSSSRPTS